MPCITSPVLTPSAKQRQREALDRLQRALAAGTVTIKVGREGSIAFAGWRDEDREGISDLCAYRAIANDPTVRRALLRAEALSGNRYDPRAIASGLHSHDGGATWSRH